MDDKISDTAEEIKTGIRVIHGKAQGRFKTNEGRMKTKRRKNEVMEWLMTAADICTCIERKRFVQRQRGLCFDWQPTWHRRRWKQEYMTAKSGEIMATTNGTRIDAQSAMMLYTWTIFMVSTSPYCYYRLLLLLHTYVVFFSLSTAFNSSLFLHFQFPHFLLPLSSSSTHSSIILLLLLAFSLLLPCLFFLCLLFFSDALSTNSSSSYFFIFLFTSFFHLGLAVLSSLIFLHFLFLFSPFSHSSFPIRLLFFASNSFRFSYSYSL